MEPPAGVDMAEPADENKNMGQSTARVGKTQRGGPLGLVMAAGLAALSMAALLACRPPPGLAGLGAGPEPQPARASGPALAALPISVEPGQSHRQLAVRVAKTDSFLALALGVEGSPERAYVDAAGANAGAGYCVEMRRRARGEGVVRDELSRAGFAGGDIESLLSRDGARIEGVRVSQAQSLRLLVISKPQYQEMARRAVGAAVFDALPPHKRNVLSYLAYNTGGPEKFVKLIDAVRVGNDVEALSQLGPSVSIGKRKKLKNHRLRAWAQAAWMGGDELGKALEKPLEFELAYAGQTGQAKFIQSHWSFLSENAKAMAARRGAGAPTLGEASMRLAKKREVEAREKVLAAGRKDGVLKALKA